QRGDAPNRNRLLDDIEEFIAPFKSMRRADPGTPLFLVGISWGGKLAVALALRKSGLADGLALLCPGFCPRVRPSFINRLRIAAAGLVSPGKYFPIPLNDAELFTESRKWQEFVRADALGLHQATARLFLQSVRLDHYVRRKSRRI